MGKTTLATNLAIYTRALREDLPVLVVGLDDQGTLDRMFALRELRPGDANLKHAWAERSLASAAQLGQYGVHFVPSPPDVALLKARAGDPRTLRADPRADRVAGPRDPRHEERSRGAHPERLLTPPTASSCRSRTGRRSRRPRRSSRCSSARASAPRARAIVFTLVDRRSRIGGGEGPTLFARLRDEVRRRGWAYYKTALSRSPRVETLNSASRTPLSILHHAKGTEVHAQFRELTLEVLGDLGISDRLDLAPRASASRPTSSGARRRRAAARRAASGAARWVARWRSSDEHLRHRGRRRARARASTA